MSDQLHPLASHHLPFFITAPGETDVLFNITLWFVVACIILTGVIFFTIHSLPERMAHKSKKILLDPLPARAAYARTPFLVCGNRTCLH